MRVADDNGSVDGLDGGEKFGALLGQHLIRALQFAIGALDAPAQDVGIVEIFQGQRRALSQSFEERGIAGIEKAAVALA